MVRGRDVHQPRVARDRVDDQALRIHGYPGHPRPQRREQSSRRCVAGIFDDDAVAGGHQCTRHDVDRLLRAVRDDHVVARRDDAAGDADVPGDRLAQPAVSRRVRILPVPDRRGAQLTCHQATPCLVGEQARIGNPGAEVEPRRPPELGGKGHFVPERARAQHARWPLQIGATRLAMAADEGPRADTRRHEALAHQTVVRDVDGRPRNAQPPRQLATRRQTLAFAQPPVEDQGPQLSVDFAGEVMAADEADVELHCRRWYPSLLV